MEEIEDRYKNREYVCDGSELFQYYESFVECYRPIRYMCKYFNEEELLNHLKKMKYKFKCPVTLEVQRVNLEFLEKVHDILGDMLFISPLYAQYRVPNTGNVIDTYPKYTYEEIVEKEKRLDFFARSVQDKRDKDGNIKSLSPLEKFVAAYLMTIKFAEYQEESNPSKESHTSRSVYEFIDVLKKPNIVCVGYINLLKELLYRMGIKEVFEVSYKPPNGTAGHSMLAIHIVDPKYNVDTLFISDPTADAWGVKYTNFHHAIMTNDELKKNEDYSINLDEAMDENEFYKFYYDKFNKCYFYFDRGTYGYNGKMIWNIRDGFNIPHASQLFNNSISGDTLVKAYLSLIHFIDNDMKMVDNNEYPYLEYAEATVNIIGYNDFVIDDDKLFQECIKHEFFELKNNYKYMYGNFRFIILERLKKINEDLCFHILKKEDTKKEYVAITYMLDTYNDEVINIIKSKYKIMDYNGCICVILYELSDKPIIEEIDDIKKAYNKFINEYSKISRKILGNRVK